MSRPIEKSNSYQIISTNLKNNHADKFPVLFVDRLSYIQGCIIESPLMMYKNKYVHNLHIGKYCSLANDIKFVINLNHDYLKVNTGYLNTNIIEYLNKYDFKIKRKGQILIQNDVWIGKGAMILPSVTIHNGSVIGAGSVVTKDVPPYSIVAGNPAKVIKYRFDKNIIEKLLSIKWWDWTVDKINENIHMFDLPVEEFVNKFFDNEKHNTYLKKLENKVDNITRYLYIPDLEYKFSTWKNVIEEFNLKYGEYFDKELVIFMLNDSNLENKSDKIIELNDFLRSTKNIKVISGNEEDLENNFLNSHHYITNRSVETIKYSCIADYYNVKIISGVDIPVF